MKLRFTAASALVLCLLSACGGGRGNDDTTASATNRVPASALVSATAYSEWAESLVNGNSGTEVAFDDGMTAPKSETDLPITVR